MAGTKPVWDHRRGPWYAGLELIAPVLLEYPASGMSAFGLSGWISNGKY
jgi:hypothetical protein